MGEANSLGTGMGTTLYHYPPSLSLAVTFCSAFGVCTTLHIYQAIITKSWYMLPIITGGVFETVGYVGRILGANEAPNYALGPYIMQAIFILVAPTMIAASVYMILGHIIRATDGDECSMIRERILTKLFVMGDVISFMIQSTGASILTKKEQSKKEVGNIIIIGGLAVQLLFFGLFMVTTSVFRARLKLDKSSTPTHNQTSLRWRLQTAVLLFCSSLIMMRSIFRVVEYAQGQNGYLMTHESFQYIFDASLMFIATAILNIVHPSKISAFNKGGGGKAISWIVNREAVHTKTTGLAHCGSDLDEETACKPVTQDV